jgi:regulatory protein
MSRKPGQKKWISKYDALEKLQRYCAYQDRCHQQVRKKLLDLGIYGDELEEIIAELIEEKFLDEILR